MVRANLAEVEQGIIAAVTSKLGDSTDAESQFFSTSQAFKKSKISGDQFVSYVVETLGADTADVVLPLMILLLARYPERQQSLRDVIANAHVEQMSSSVSTAQSGLCELLSTQPWCADIIIPGLHHETRHNVTAPQSNCAFVSLCGRCLQPGSSCAVWSSRYAKEASA